MNTTAYTRLLAQPTDLREEDLQDLDGILERYPFFQSARALQLKSLKDSNSYRYNDALRLTAAHTTDRDVLFDYITSERFTQNEVSEQILQNSEAVRAMEVVSEDLSAQIRPVCLPTRPVTVGEWVSKPSTIYFSLKLACLKSSLSLICFKGHGYWLGCVCQR